MVIEVTRVNESDQLVEVQLSRKADGQDPEWLVDASAIDAMTCETFRDLAETGDGVFRLVLAT